MCKYYQKNFRHPVTEAFSTLGWYKYCRSNRKGLCSNAQNRAVIQLKWSGNNKYYLETIWLHRQTLYNYRWCSPSYWTGNDVNTVKPTSVDIRSNQSIKNGISKGWRDLIGDYAFIFDRVVVCQIDFLYSWKLFMRFNRCEEASPHTAETVWKTTIY